MSYSYWKGISFHEKIRDDNLPSKSSQVQISRKACAVAPGIAASLGMSALFHSYRWITSGTGESFLALGPSGISFGKEKSWDFSLPNYNPDICRDHNNWLTYYGFCKNSTFDYPAPAYLSFWFAWGGSLLSFCGGFLGFRTQYSIRYSAIFILLSTLSFLFAICTFLNWNYPSDLLFEKALVFIKEQESNMIIFQGPVKMKFGTGLWMLIFSFLIDFFTIISMRVLIGRE